MAGLWTLLFATFLSGVMPSGGNDVHLRGTAARSADSTTAVLDTIQVRGEHDYDLGYHLQGAPGWAEWVGYRSAVDEFFSAVPDTFILETVLGEGPSHGSDLEDLRSSYAGDGYAIRVGLLRHKGSEYRSVLYELVVDEVDRALIYCRGRPHESRYLRLDQAALDRITRGRRSASPKFIRWLGPSKFLLSMSGAALIVARMESGQYEFAFTAGFYLDLE
jgi:hypothetical protein